MTWLRAKELKTQIWVMADDFHLPAKQKYPIFEKAEFPLKDYTHTLGRIFLDPAEV